MSCPLKPIKWLYNEFGLASVYNTGRDAYLVILSRSCRMFAYAATSLIMALFFSSLHFTDFQIGLFMTLTLVGDVLLSLSLSLVADRIGRRRILLGGSALMILSGSIFAVFENFWILLAAAVVGVLSATGGDFGPFRAIEESTLSHLTSPKTRSDVLSWYITISSLGSAAGTGFSGRAVDYLRTKKEWEIKDAYHAIFWLYIAMGILNMVLTLLMSDKCELVVEENEPKTEAEEGLLKDGQHDSDDEDGDDENKNEALQPQTETPRKRSLFSQISSETRTIAYKLWLLLAVDSLADGMVNLPLTYYYMDRKLHLSKSTLGDISSASYFLSSASTVFAGPLAHRLGLINTMVFTHIPSSAAVLLFPIPKGVVMTVILFFIRTGLNNMDQAPRAAFIAAVVKPEERTAVMGITSMLRTLASTVGPSVTGLLAGNDTFWIAYVVAGSLRLCYDVGLWAIFVNMRLDKHEPVEGAKNPRRESDEEELTEFEPAELTHGGHSS